MVALRHLALGAVVLLACIAPLGVAAWMHPTPIDWRHLRFDPTARRVEAATTTEVKYLARSVHTALRAVTGRLRPARWRRA